MKTKLFRVGRSSVSVILAVMMLLSTMLVGTVTTANAATIQANTNIYLDIKDAVANFTDSNSIYVSLTSSSNQGYSADASNTSGAGSYKPTNDTKPWYKMTKVGDTLYMATITSESTIGKLSFWNKDESGYDNVWQASCALGVSYDGVNNLYTLTKSTYHENRQSNIYSGTWSTYSNFDPVADSVTLTADPTSVKVGKSVTLTATAVNPAVGNVTYTFKKTSGGSVAESQNGNTLTVTPSEAGAYTYTVTASADGYSDVTSTAVSFTATEDASVVSDSKLISVLDGSKIMFYGGEAANWNQTTFYAMSSNDVSSAVDDATMSVKKTIDNSSYKFALLSVPAGSYYLGHWASGLKYDVSAGDTFIVWGTGTISGYKQVATSGSNALYKSNADATKTADTSLSATEVKTGELIGVTTSTSAGSSSLGYANTFEYYVGTPEGKFYKLTLNDGKFDTSTFETEGEYSLKTVLKDENGLYVLADSDDFVISNKAKFTVTFGSNSDTMGSVTAKDGSGNVVNTGSSVVENTSVTFTANANDGYEVEGWYSDADCTTAITGATGTTYTTTVTADTSVYVKFKTRTFAITSSDGEGYTVSDLVSQAEFNAPVSFTVIPKTGYQIDSVKANDTDAVKGEDGKYTFTMPAKNVAISVTASLVSYNINNGGDDTLTFKVDDKAVTTANMGNKVTVSGEKTGYTLTSIEVVDDNGETVVVDDLTFTMPASAVTVTPTFTANTYTITVNKNANCTVTVGSIAAYNSYVNVTVKPNDGFNVTGITVKDTSDKDVTVSGSAAAGYTFTMPASNVTITPSVEAVNVTAPNVTLNGGAGSTSENISANQNYVVTAIAKPNDNYSEITSKNISVTGGTAGTDYTLVETADNTGVYNFVALKEGTYTVTFTATATSKNDKDKSESAEATLTITVSYTDTQKAYLALEEYVNTVKDTSADDYTTDSFATFSSALKAAQALLTGLPKADETDAETYTSAKTTLESAYKGLVKDVVLDLYVTGRFQVKNSTGTHTIGWSETGEDSNFKFTRQDNGLYSLDTGCTLAELSSNVKGPSDTGSAEQYFFIMDSSNNKKLYQVGGAGPISANGQENAAPLVDADTAKPSVRFYNGTDTSGVVTLWVDASGDTYKFYYTVKRVSKYKLIGQNGPFTTSWSTSSLVSIPNQLGSDDIFYTDEIEVTGNTKVYFRLYDGSSQYSAVGYTSTGKDYDILANSSSKESAANTVKATDGSFVINKSGKYIIYVDQSGTTPKVWIEEAAQKYNVNIAEGVNAVADKTQAKQGETVTITVTPETGKILESVTVKGADDTDVSTTVNGNTATFTMPAQDVTVTEVKFRDAKKFTVKFSSGNDSYGSVSASYNGKTQTTGFQVYEGDKVTFTATPNGDYSFINWTVNGSVAPSTDNPFTIAINEDTTVVGNFDDDPGTLSNYYILWGTNQNFNSYESVRLYEKNGQYYAKFNVESDSISTGKDYFFVFSTTNTTSGVTAEQTNVEVNEYRDNDFYFEKRSETIEGRGYTKFAKIYNANNDLISFKVIVSDINLSTKKLTYSCEPTFDVAPAGSIEITAKDGTVRSGFATNASLGDTTIEVVTPEGKTLNASDSYNNLAQTVKKVPDGSTVTVTTTIDESKTFAGVQGSGYYVKGFSINGIFGGVLSQSEGKAHDSNVYSFTFTVNQELYNETKLEITPVYFLKDDSNCVYFYIENYEAASGIWGNTPACYVYYDNHGSNAFGDYPGQPLVDYNGSIFTQIPKFVDGDTSKKITGMTLNNYVWDDVHAAYNGKVQKDDNAQTYDYDDFVQIAESGAQADNIIYRYKYNTTDNHPADTLSASVCDPDGWEVFLDYQNYPTDIFGNKLGNTKLDYKDLTKVTENDEYLSIISDGYQNNYIGNYATAWSIYNKAGEIVATIPSSALLYALGKTDAEMTTAIDSSSTPTDFLPGKKDRDSYWSTFKSLYKSYKGTYAQINFEGAISGGAQYGNRLDGRWYYSQNAQEITGEIKIQYGNTLDDFKIGDYKEDTFADDEVTSVKGTETGAEAYFTDPVNKVRKLTTTADNTQDYKFEVQATSTAAYTFVGWYRLIDGDYKAVNPSDISSLTGAVTRNADVTLVARYIKTPGGSMTFNHSLYAGENAGGGTATTEIQVVVKDSDGTSLYDSGRIAGTASIDKDTIAKLAALENVSVTVTLYTTTKNLDNFNGYYDAENTTTLSEFAPADLTTTVDGDRYVGLVTKSEYTFSFNEYYNKYASTLVGDNPGTVYHNFYSDVSYIKVPYKVQFSYIDREGKTKYYNKAGYVDPKNTSSYTFVDKDVVADGVDSHAVEVTLTNSFILSLAPYESNFTKNLTWNETPDSNTAFDSSVSKSIASAVVKSTQYDKTIHLNVFTDGENPVPLDDEDGAFEPFEKNGTTELPYNSVFYTTNADGTYTYDIVAPKTYTNAEGKELKFMYWAIYSDADCKNLVIKAYNIDGGFSYVSYDNYWIVPVYGENSSASAAVKEIYASTQFMEATRNQWTADSETGFNGFDADSMATLDSEQDFIKGNNEDKLYADFVLNFFYNGKQLNVFDPNSKSVQTGIVMQKLDLDTGDSGWGYNTDMEHYANKYSADELKAAADDAIKKAKGETSDIPSLSKQIDNSRLNNKNRLQYYARFNNTESNTNCVYRVYTYVKYVDGSGNTVVELGDPIYFTFYDVANATA